MSEAKKLTAEAVLAGEVDVDQVTGKELETFIKENDLDVKPGRTKADTLNAICDALDVDDGSAPPPADDPDADEPDEPDVLGEPDVEQSSYLARRADKIRAGRDELGAIGSNIEEEAKKSSFIARRLRSK